ncbi:hypothetical protein M9Y10_032012 [Tritrichomonas musculus]|uniref:Myb-like DNA-binding domain containing protein n=1 Tax=Tritrichomonas musculus TaxID=1915356 RepID=A0ABR2H1C0_9EUKA
MNCHALDASTHLSSTINEKSAKMTDNALFHNTHAFPIGNDSKKQYFELPFIANNSTFKSNLLQARFIQQKRKSILKLMNIKFPRKIKKKTKTKSEENKNIGKKFSAEEDEKLKHLVEIMGEKKWDDIAKEMPGRNGRQCRDRYKNYLIQGFFNGEWTREEDEMLIKKFSEFGSQWSKITTYFNNRNANSLKNRWNYFLSKHLNDNTFSIQEILNKNDDEINNRLDINTKRLQLSKNSNFVPTFDFEDLGLEDGYDDFDDKTEYYGFPSILNS